MGTYFWERDGICIRNFRSDDADLFQDMLYQTDYRMQMEHGIPLPACHDDGENLIAWIGEGQEDIWLAIESGEDTFVGYAILRCIDDRSGNLELFLTIFPKWQRRGYGRSACNLLKDYIFGERRMYKINCYVMEGNEAGKAFLEQMGFREECYRREMFYSHGKYWGEYNYGITKEMNNAEDEVRRNGQQLEPEQQLGTGQRRSEQQGTEQQEIMQQGIEQLEIGQQKDEQQNSKLQNNDPQKNKFQRKVMQIKEQFLQIAPAKFLPIYGKRPYFWEYDGIRLRETTEEDCVKQHELLYDSQGCRFFDNDVKLPCDIEKLSDFDEEHLGFGGEDGRIVFTVEDMEGEYVGSIQLCGIDQKNGKFSFSIYTDQARRKCGYGKKALYVVLCYAFFELRLNKCVTTVNEGNTSSLTLMGKLGFEFEGVQSGMAFYNNHYVDVIQLGLTRQQFTDRIEQVI